MMKKKVAMSFALFCFVTMTLMCQTMPSPQWDNPLDTNGANCHVVKMSAARSMKDTTVAIEDTVRLHAKAYDSIVSGTKQNSIVMYYWSTDSGYSWLQSSPSDSAGIRPIIWSKSGFGDSSRVFHIAVKARTEDSAWSDTLRFSITVTLEPPAVAVGKDTSITVGDTIRLSGTATSRFTIKEYAWNLGTKGAFVPVTDGDTTLIAPLTPQTITYTLRVKDIRGIMGTANKVVTIVPVGLVWDDPVLGKWDASSWK